MASILSIQFEPVINDKQANLEKVAKFLEESAHKKPDLVVLPEFFLTGISDEYCDNPEPVEGSFVLSALSALAKKYSTNIVAGSIVIKDGESLYNSSFALNRQGEIIARYDKIHLFDYFGGEEGRKIWAGDKHVVADFDFAKVGPSICYDIRYPMHHRRLAQMGAEIIVSPTAWGYLNSSIPQEIENMRSALEAMSIARSFENLIYFVTCDQCKGAGGFVSTVGSSMIVSPIGAVLAHAGEGECAIYAELDLEPVRELKNLYPVAHME